MKVPPRWRGILLGLTIIPFWTNFLVRTLGWLILLQPNGALSGILQDLHLIASPLDVLDTREAVQLGVVYNYLPLMIFPLFVALDRLDPALREASKDLGANRWDTFRQVTLPLAFPGVAAGLLLVFIPLTGDYITAAVLGGAKGNMVGALVASQFNAAQNWALGSAMAVILILMILGSVAFFAVLGLIVRAIIRRTPTRRDRTGDRMSAVTQSRHVRRDPVNVLLGVWGIVVFVFLFLPILMIVIYSFNDGRALVVWKEFGLRPYVDALDNPTIRNAIFTSIRAALGAALISTVCGSLAGIALARRSGKWTIGFLALLFLVLVTPEIVDAISLLDLVRADRRAVRPRQRHPQLRPVPPLGRPLDLRDGGGHTHRPRPAGGPGRVPRGGVGRSLRASGSDVPEDHVAADDAGGPGGRAARVQPEPGQHDHLVVRLDGERLAVAGVRAQFDPRRHAAGDRGDVHPGAPADLVRAVPRRGRAAEGWPVGRGGRRDDRRSGGGTQVEAATRSRLAIASSGGTRDLGR